MTSWTGFHSTACQVCLPTLVDYQPQERLARNSHRAGLACAVVSLNGCNMLGFALVVPRDARSAPKSFPPLNWEQLRYLDHHDVIIGSHTRTHLIVVRRIQPRRPVSNEAVVISVRRLESWASNRLELKSEVIIGIPICRLGLLFVLSL